MSDSWVLNVLKSGTARVEKRAPQARESRRRVAIKSLREVESGEGVSPSAAD